MRYAQIDERAVAIGISELSGPVDAPHMIPLEDGHDVMGMKWIGSEWIEGPPPPLPPINQLVDAERDRRLVAGTTFADHLFQTDQLDRERIDRSRISAIAAIMGGAQKGDLRWHGQPVDFFWIAADNTRVEMDAQTMVAFGNAVAAREGLLIITGNDLKRRLEAGEELGDIGSDALWPA